MRNQNLLPPLSMQGEKSGSTVRLVVSGELDLASAPLLDRALSAATDEVLADTVILDIERVSFMDSTGLRCLLTAHARAGDRGRVLVVVNRNEEVRRLFQLTGTDALFDPPGARGRHSSHSDGDGDWSHISLLGANRG